MKYLFHFLVIRDSGRAKTGTRGDEKDAKGRNLEVPLET